MQAPGVVRAHGRLDVPSVAGLDWATEPKARALVQLEVPEGRGPLAVLDVLPRVDSRGAPQRCADPAHAVVGVDIPFGWPRAFSRFVAGWRVAGGGAAPPGPREFRCRLTDRAVKAELGKEPLSVSADRIAMGARAWVDLVAAGGLAPRIDVSGSLCAERPTLIEVYPGATMVALRRPEGAEELEAAAEEGWIFSPVRAAGQAP